jgi:hypothetical protein
VALLQGKPLAYGPDTPYRCARYIERASQRPGLSSLVLVWQITYAWPGGGVTTWGTSATSEGGARAAIVRRLRAMSVDPRTALVSVWCGSYDGYRGDGDE